MTRRLALVCCLVASLASAVPWDGVGAGAYAQFWANWPIHGHDGCRNYFESGGNCCNFASRAATEKDSLNDSIGGKVKFWGMRESVRVTGPCSRERIFYADSNAFAVPLNSKGHFTSISRLKRCLTRSWTSPVSGRCTGCGWAGLRRRESRTAPAIA